MNELLDYLLEVTEELEDVMDDINCASLSTETNRLHKLANCLKEKIKYYKGFAANEDKKKIRCFLAEMTDGQAEAFEHVNQSKAFNLKLVRNIT